MGIVINGVGIGFFAAFFISMYGNWLFNYQLPFVIIYGIIGPFLSAIAIGIQVLVRKEKEKRDRVEGYVEDDNIRMKR